MKTNKQPIRSLIAFVVTWAFIVLTFTGIILYIVPQGRVSYWVHWSLAGMEKEQWGWVHMMFGGIFIITGFVHLYFNWKPFKKYLADRAKGKLQIKQEFITATALTVAVFVVSAANLPPASWVIDLNSWVKSSWVTSPDLEPPYGHAEEASLAGISKKMDFDLAKVLIELEHQGIQFNDKRDSLDTIARRNQTTPMAIYKIIKVHKLAQLESSNVLLSPEEIEAKYSGTGLGRKTLAEISLEVGVDLEHGLVRLAEAGILATAEDKARPVADKYQQNPIDLLKIMMQP